MAARRGRTVSITPEPVAEPEPDKVETDIPPEKTPSINESDKTKSSAIDVMEKSNCPEKIIERIIICPGGQDIRQLCGPRPCPFHPPPFPALSSQDNDSKKKTKKKKKNGDHSKMDKDMSLITTVGDSKTDKSRQARNKGHSSSPQTNPPPVIIYHQPITCCCSSSSEDSDDDDEEDEGLIDPSTFISFANMVFAAANIMSEHPDAY